MPFYSRYMMYGAYNPGGEFCTDPMRNVSRWCTYGCCGDHDTECCTSNVAMIVGVSMLSLVVVCCVTLACCCCCLRRRRKAQDSSGQVSGMQQPPSYDSTTGGVDCTYTATTPGGSCQPDQPPLPHYPTQNYPPGCYAPPAYNQVQLPSSSSSSASTMRQAYSTPLPPPPYSQELTGQDNKAFKMSE